MNRHTFGTDPSQTRALFAGSVSADEGGGLSPTLLKGGGRPADMAEGGVSL
jgi:hypothetical protein